MNTNKSDLFRLLVFVNNDLSKFQEEFIDEHRFNMANKSNSSIWIKKILNNTSEIRGQIFSLVIQHDCVATKDNSAPLLFPWRWNRGNGGKKEKKREKERRKKKEHNDKVKRSGSDKIRACKCPPNNFHLRAEFPCVRDTRQHEGEEWEGKRKHVKNRITQKTWQVRATFGFCAFFAINCGMLRNAPHSRDNSRR